MVKRSEIIKRLAVKLCGTENNVTEEDLQQCTQMCDYLVDIFTDALTTDGKIVWNGFLSAEVIERGARKGRNPKTNEIVVFPPVKIINCRMSKHIKDAVNKK